MARRKGRRVTVEEVRRPVTGAGDALVVARWTSAVALPAGRVVAMYVIVRSGGGWRDRRANVSRGADGVWHVRCRTGRANRHRSRDWCDGTFPSFVEADEFALLWIRNGGRVLAVVDDGHPLAAGVVWGLG